MTFAPLPGIFLSGDTIRPIRIAGQPCRAPGGSGGFDVYRDPYFNGAAFSQPAAFTFGNASARYSDCRVPAFINEDISLLKNIRFGERRSLQFRAEFFNLFNRTVFGGPNLDVSSPTFGRLLAQDNTPRQIQFVLKLRF